MMCFFPHKVECQSRFFAMQEYMFITASEEMLLQRSYAVMYIVSIDQGDSFKLKVAWSPYLTF